MDYATHNCIGQKSGAGAEMGFVNAPLGWTCQQAEETAEAEGLELTPEHWRLIHALQEFYARNESPTINLRELHDALDESFHHAGGLKHLYELFPGGPVAQGCRLAGLPPPAGAQDKGFGSSV